MKAQLITHTIVIGFGIILIVSIILILNSSNLEYQEFVSEKELEETCLVIKSAIDKIQIETDYGPDTETTLGKLNVNLPEKIADINYRAAFDETNISIEMLGGPRKSYSCIIGIQDVTFVGSTNGGLTEVKYTRHKDANVIEMRKI